MPCTVLSSRDSAMIKTDKLPLSNLHFSGGRVLLRKSWKDPWIKNYLPNQPVTMHKNILLGQQTFFEMRISMEIVHHL